MRELNLDLPEDGRPFYLRLAEAVRGAIRTGRARPGEALPSTRTLAGTAGVHRHTVMAALDELVAEGWLVARPGAAYRVTPQLPDDFFQPSRSVKSKSLRGTSPAAATVALKPARRVALPVAAPSDLPYAFRSGLGDLLLFPYDELRGHLGDALKRDPLAVAGFSDPAGAAPFLAELSTYLRRVRAVVPDKLVVTHGSQEGIYLTGQLLCAAGDTIAVERVGYPPAWEALRSSGARLHPLGMDAEGVDPDDLARLAKRRRVKLVYLTPLHQYPTTVTLSAPRRVAIYETAARHGIAILEDDYDHEFHYRSQPVAPLAASDPAGVVLYASTFSKVLFPSARLGYLGVPGSVGEPLRALKRIVSRQNDGLLQAAVARWMAEGGFERHLRRMRREYGRRLDALVAALAHASESVPALSWRVPDGGMALWLDTPWDSREAARAAAAAGVFVHAGADFQLEPGPDTHLRLGFACLDPARISEGVARLVAACRALPRRG